MKDLHSDMTVVAAIAAAVYASDPVPPALDLQGYRGAEFVLSIGVGGIVFTGSNKIDFELTESDDDVTYSPVAAEDVLGAPDMAAGIVKSLTSAHAAAGVYRFGYRGTKRYLKLVPNFSGSHGTGTPIAATLIKGHGNLNPQDDQA